MNKQKETAKAAVCGAPEGRADKSSKNEAPQGREESSLALKSDGTTNAQRPSEGRNLAAADISCPDCEAAQAHCPEHQRHPCACKANEACFLCSSNKGIPVELDNSGILHVQWEKVTDDILVRQADRVDAQENKERVWHQQSCPMCEGTSVIWIPFSEYLKTGERPPLKKEGFK
jgi:hypothetical protein